MIEFLCTITGIIAGIAVVASVMRAQPDKSKWQHNSPPAAPEAENMQGIADQLRLLTFRVSADVSAHSEKVENLSDRLHEPEEQEPDHVLSAINELISANQTMQSQLADARKRIAHQSEMIEEASVQARTDALTGLANRRALNEFLQNCVESIQPGESASLLLLDIDHFKSFNDTYGHITGDAVLSAFARSIKKWCGPDCYSARYGGEEFAVIITGRSPEEIASKAAKLRKHICEQTISFEDLQLRITCSGGLSSLKRGDTIEAAYERADDGLYRAKKAGRDRGFWLSGSEWLPFPAIVPTPAPAVERGSVAAQIAEAQAAAVRSVAEEPSEHSDHPMAEDTASGRVRKPNAQPQTSEATDHARSQKGPSNSGEVLDLGSFVERLGTYLEQLRRADLPATAIMIEAVGLAKLPANQAKASWAEVVGIVQSQLRGIDVACLFRPFTLCILMPGCSIDSAADRSSRIQLNLEEIRDNWEPAENCPDRFAIAVATAGDTEETGSFLQRLEAAMEEAIEVDASEIVVHDGRSFHSQKAFAHA